MGFQTTSAIDSLNPAEETSRKNPYATPAFEAHRKLVQANLGQKNSALTETYQKEGKTSLKASETNRMRRMLSAKEELAVNPKTLPKNNMMAMYKLMFQAADTLKKFVESERSEMKDINKSWEKHSDTKAKHHLDASWWQSNIYGPAQFLVMGASITLPILAGQPRFAAQAEMLKWSSKKISELIPGAVQQHSEHQRNQTDSKMTRTDYSKDSARMEFEISRDELRQLEGAVDQIHNLMHELMRLEAKGYTREGG